MKKLLSFVIAVIMILSAMVLTVGAAFDKDGKWIPANGKWDAISRDGVVARFAIGADPHFILYNSSEKVSAVYSALKQIGGVDAFMMAGDLTDYAKPEEYTALMECVNKHTKKNDLNPDANGDCVGMTVLTMGNHEHADGWSNHDWKLHSTESEEKFTEYTGQQPDTLHWINGIPVIAISSDNDIPERSTADETGNSYDLSYDFLKGAYKTIDDTGYDGAIFLIAHHRTATDGTENNYWSKDMMDLIKAHPNTMIFTGHSHTWIDTTKSFILQDGGFTHVRAGSLGNNYGGLGDADVNPSTGTSINPLQTADDSNCSLVLADVLADGTVKLRRLDIAKGRYMFPDEDFIIDPKSIGYYTSIGEDGTYGYGTMAPSFPENAKITVEDMGNNSSVTVRFPEAVPATSLAKDFISEYRICLKDSDGNYHQYEGKNYLRVANYRSVEDEGKDWSVLIHALAWDTDYTVQVQARTAYGAASKWITCNETVNVGHLSDEFPTPVFDFDYSYGSAKDGAGHDLLKSPTVVKDVDIGGQKAANILGIGGLPYIYDFTEKDFLAVKHSFTMECYFNASDVKSEQDLMGGQLSCHLAFKIKEGKLHVWANIVSLNSETAEQRLILSADIDANEWYHAMAVYDSRRVQLYLNGELAATLDNAPLGLVPAPYDSEGEIAEDGLGMVFCVGASHYDEEDGAANLMHNCMINKATLYAGAMTEKNVKTAYKIATTALPFTDVKDSWYIDSVEYAYNTGLMKGSSETTFSPSVQTNRAMIVQMLYNLEGAPEVDTTDNPFTDVPAKKWYTNAVLWAYQNGVTTGTSKTTFSPDTLVTREQVAVFLYRYLKDYKKADVGEGADLSAYPDADSISKYAGFKEAVAWANANGIIGGKKNGEVITLAPLDKAMRSEVAKMFVSFAKKY